MKTLLSFFMFCVPLTSLEAESSLSDRMGYPELPQLDSRFSASGARVDSLVHPEKRYPNVTDGVALRDASGNLVVLDDIDEPNCVFYGNHVSGNTEIEIHSEIHIENLELDCN